jgi:hypothetical protein
MYRCFMENCCVHLLPWRRWPNVPTFPDNIPVHGVSIPRNARACEDSNHLRYGASSLRRFEWSGFFTSGLLSDAAVEGNRSHSLIVTACAAAERRSAATQLRGTQFSLKCMYKQTASVSLQPVAVIWASLQLSSFKVNIPLLKKRVAEHCGAVGSFEHISGKCRFEFWPGHCPLWLMFFCCCFSLYIQANSRILFNWTTIASCQTRSNS